MVRYPQTDDNVAWARDAEDFLIGAPDAIELFGSRVAPAEQLLKRHFGAELLERIENFDPAESNWGDEELKLRVGRYEAVSPEHVLLTAGATQAFDLVCRGFLRAGDEVILERPGYQVLARIATDFGATVKNVRRGAGTNALDLDELRSACSDKTRLIALMDLHNPTGSHLTDRFVEKLAGLAAEAGAVLLVDEVYRDFLPDSERRRAFHEPPEGLVRINSLAKTFGVDHLSCGWLIASPGVRARLRAPYARSLISVSKLALRAAIVVFDHLDDYLDHQRRVMARNKPVFAAFMREASENDLLRGTVPAYGPIALVEAVDARDDALWPWLAETRDILLIPGEIYGRPGCTRIGFGGHTERLKEALDRLLDGLMAWRRRGAE